MAVFLPAGRPCVHSGVEAVALFRIAAGDGFGVGIFRRGHADDGERHLMLHHKAELGAVRAVGALGHRAERHHQVVGGVGGVGALVGGGIPVGDKVGEKLLGSPGFSGLSYKEISDVDDGLVDHILLPGIIGVVVRPAAVRRAFGGELRARGQRPGRAVVGEAEVFSDAIVDGLTIALLLLHHLVEPYLVSGGELGGEAALHGAGGGGGGVIFIVRRGRRGVCAVGDGDGERRGGRGGAVGGGSGDEAVVVGSAGGGAAQRAAAPPCARMWGRSYVSS